MRKENYNNRSECQTEDGERQEREAHNKTKLSSGVYDDGMNDERCARSSGGD